MTRATLALIILVGMAGCLDTQADGTAPAMAAVSDIDPAPQPPADLLQEQEALARSLVLSPPTLVLEGRLQTFGTALASYGDGTRLAAAGVKAGDYYVLLSDDAGLTWNDPIQATSGAGATTHSAQPAQIAFGGPDEIHINYASGGVHHVVSRDGGATWSDPVEVDPEGSGLDGFTAMDANEDGTVAVIWLRGQNEGGNGVVDTIRGYYGAISTDGGQSFGPAELFPGQNEPCDCCSASVVVRDDGTAFAMWRNIFDSGPAQERDYVLTVHDGDVWSEPQRLDPSGWRYNGCPASASDMSLAPDGTVTGTWWTGVASGPGYHIGTVAPGETEMVTHQGLQYDAPAGASASATDGLGNAWVLWGDESTNPTTLRLARGEAGSYTTLGTFEGYDWPRLVGTPEGFVAVFMDQDQNLQVMRGGTPLSPAIIQATDLRGPAPLQVDVALKAAGGVMGTWTFHDGRNNTLDGVDLPYQTTLTFDEPGTYLLRLTIDDGSVVHNATLPIVAERALSLPEATTFRAGPLAFCLDGCLSMQAGPEGPAIDGFWTPVTEEYWGLVGAVEGDVVNPLGGGTGVVAFLDEELNILDQGVATAVPDGAAWAFAYGDAAEQGFGGAPGIFSELRLTFTLPPA